MIRKLLLTAVAAGTVIAGSAATATDASAAPQAPSTAATVTVRAGVVGTVRTGGTPLTVRVGASQYSARVTTVPNQSKVAIKCQVRGEWVNGTFGRSNLWDYIGNGFVSDAYVQTGSNGQVAPTCNLGGPNRPIPN